MPIATPVTLTGPSGARIKGGYFGVPVLTGSVTAADAVGSGALGSAAPPPPAINWQFADAATLATARNTTTLLATGVPSGATVLASPDLLPGQTLAINGNVLNLVGDSTVPTVSGGVPVAGGAIIEVMDTAQAVATNMRTGQQFGAGQSGSFARIQYAIKRAQDGDTIQISPGAVWIPGNGDGSAYLEGSMLALYKSLTLTNIPGRGRWRLAPPDVAYVDNYSGLVIREPNQGYSDVGDVTQTTAPKTYVIEGFDFDNWGRGAGDGGVIMRHNSGAASWAGYTSSITFRNFKLGKKPFYPSASGFNGSAENMVFENGLVYDTGDGINAAPGNDHNFYVTARNLTMRGVRAIRTRSAQFPYSQGNTMDGHIAKLTFNNALLEGCIFYCGPEGDNSITVQCKGGGNLTMRGCLLTSGFHSNTATGSVVFEKEANNFGGWMFGLEGHSLLVERNLFISHLPYVASQYERAMVYFRPSSHGNYLDQSLITSCVVRDNIGMNPVPDTLWVRNPPSAFSGAWTTANSVMTYGIGEPGFSDDSKALMEYQRTAGPIAASGSLTTKRFKWPSGFVSRTDAYQGLG